MLILFLNCKKEARPGTGTPSIVSKVVGSRFYVDATQGNDINPGTSATLPWKTIDKINATTLMPGDKVSFKCGETFVGSLVPTRSGKPGAYILFNSFGSGNKPKLTDKEHTDRAKGRILINCRESYLLFDGLELMDVKIDLTDNSMPARTGYGFVYNGCTNVILKNFAIHSLGCGAAFIQGASHNQLFDSEIYEMKMLNNTRTPTNDDFGAMGVLFSDASYNEVSGCYIHSCWGPSFEYGFDGGAFEFFNSCSGNVILNNGCVNNNGFMEFGANVSAAANDNLVSNNYCQDNGNIAFMHLPGGGRFSVDVRRLKVERNIFIERRSWLTNPPALVDAHIGETSADSIVILKNNTIHLLRSGVTIKSAGKFNLKAVVEIANDIFIGQN